MIPLRLTVRNFMCYRDNVPTLSLEDLHLVCLSGDNGNGKSALIDAMTWALWGKARAKSDDDLVAAHSTDMSVEFDFAVGTRRFRIIRKRSLPRTTRGAGQSVLDFQAAGEDGYRPLAGSTIDETQRNINAVLHLDYRTFINSAYLRQGHADEFTTQRPADRKEVLGSILGLEIYDELAEMAKERARQQEVTRAQLESNLREITAEIARRPEYEEALAQAQETADRRQQLAAAKESALQELRGRKGELEKQQVALEQLTARVNDSLRQMNTWEEQLRQHRARIEAWETLRQQREDIEEGYARFLKVRKLRDELDRKAHQSRNLENQAVQREKRINEANQSLKTEHQVLQQRINDLKKKAEELPALRARRHQLQERLADMATAEQQLQAQGEDARKTQLQVSRLEAQLARLEQESKEVVEKLNLLAEQTTAHCPLCETELGKEGMELIREKYTRQQTDITAQMSAGREELETERALLASLQEELTRQESRLRQEKTSLQGELRVLEAKSAEAQEAEKQSQEAGAGLAEIEQRLARRDFAAAEQAALTALEGEITALGYDAAAHEQAQQQFTELEPYDRRHQQLEEAEKSLPGEEEAASRASEQAAILQKSLATDRPQVESLRETVAALPALREEVTRAETEHRELAQQSQQSQEALWQAKASLERCREMEVRQQEKEKLLAQAGREEGIYRELVLAFGKKGVQNLLIEMVLPEMQIEANQLLARMTDNRMTVKFETQRPTKKGEMTETLDIKIGDELGTRDYEMFSGGEAFRINFAIRIALSRLLAKRAGAALPTLIIDEGFGTQDATGIEKLKEVIGAIQNDFEKIIVITHIEELRDAFPNRINVVKTAEGSTLTVN
ncbi:MAG: SMC family ATPase [Chloroflexota bacterium]